MVIIEQLTDEILTLNALYSFELFKLGLRMNEANNPSIYPFLFN